MFEILRSGDVNDKMLIELIFNDSRHNGKRLTDSCVLRKTFQDPNCHSCEVIFRNITPIKKFTAATFHCGWDILQTNNFDLNFEWKRAVSVWSFITTNLYWQCRGADRHFVLVFTATTNEWCHTPMKIYLLANSHNMLTLSPSLEWKGRSLFEPLNEITNCTASKQCNSL